MERNPGAGDDVMTSRGDNVENTDATNHINPDELIKLHCLGFKIIPIGEDGKTPAIKSTSEVYSDPNYWSVEKIRQEAYKFKNVATVFGKSHLKDADGKDLYLNELDIDSDLAYQILFRLQNGEGPEYSLIPMLQEKTFAIKTRKPNGYRIFWLSHTQNKAIGTKDCKEGCEFEIKTDNSLGHSTLPPSRHRDDPSFHYPNIGQEKLWICDEFYDKLVEVLKECLKPLFEEGRKSHYNSHDSGTEINNEEVKIICEVLSTCYKKGYRNALVFALSGVLRKTGIAYESGLNVIQTLARDDEREKI